MGEDQDIPSEWMGKDIVIHPIMGPSLRGRIQAVGERWIRLHYVAGSRDHDKLYVVYKATIVYIHPA